MTVAPNFTIFFLTLAAKFKENFRIFTYFTFELYRTFNNKIVCIHLITMSRQLQRCHRHHKLKTKFTFCFMLYVHQQRNALEQILLTGRLIAFSVSQLLSAVFSYRSFIDRKYSTSKSIRKFSCENLNALYQNPKHRRFKHIIVHQCTQTSTICHQFLLGNFSF